MVCGRAVAGANGAGNVQREGGFRLGRPGCDVCLVCSVAAGAKPQELRTFVVLAVTNREDNVSERRPATTIGELDIHLGNVMEKLSEVQATLSTLATRNYVDEQVRLVNEKIHAAKPSTQLASFAKVAAAVMVIVAFLGMLHEVSVTLSAVRASIPMPAPVGAPK